MDELKSMLDSKLPLPLRWLPALSIQTRARCEGMAQLGPHAPLPGKLGTNTRVNCRGSSRTDFPGALVACRLPD